MNKKLKLVLAPVPGEANPKTRMTVQYETVKRIAMDLATQFPESPELTAVGQRLEELLR